MAKKNKVAVYEKPEAPLKSLERQPQMLMPAGCELVKTGLRIRGHLLFDQWSEVGDSLRKVESGVMWWLGDWLNYGEAEFGEKYAQVMDETDYSYQSLADSAWVAKAVQFSDRSECLTWSHHRVVAKCSPEEQKKWLKKACEESWSVKELKEAVNGAPEPTEKCVCPVCGASHTKVQEGKEEEL